MTWDDARPCPRAAPAYRGRVATAARPRPRWQVAFLGEIITAKWSHPSGDTSARFCRAPPVPRTQWPSSHGRGYPRYFTLRNREWSRTGAPKPGNNHLYGRVLFVMDSQLLRRREKVIQGPGGGGGTGAGASIRTAGASGGAGGASGGGAGASGGGGGASGGGGAPPSSGGIGRNMWWVNPAW